MLRTTPGSPTRGGGNPARAPLAGGADRAAAGGGDGRSAGGSARSRGGWSAARAAPLHTGPGVAKVEMLAKEAF